MKRINKQSSSTLFSPSPMNSMHPFKDAIFPENSFQIIFTDLQPLRRQIWWFICQEPRPLPHGPLCSKLTHFVGCDKAFGKSGTMSWKLLVFSSIGPLLSQLHDLSAWLFTLSLPWNTKFTTLNFFNTSRSIVSREDLSTWTPPKAMVSPQQKPDSNL